MAAAAALWGICQMYVRQNPVPAGRAGFGGSPLRAGNQLFAAIVGSPSGVVFAVSEYAESWQSVRRPGQRINLHLPELMAALARLDAGGPLGDAEYPFVLSAGERRSDTSNTSIRDPAWHRKGPFGTLRINPQDAADLGCGDGDWVRITTRRGGADAPVEISSELQPGHVSLPNGHGIDYHLADGTLVRRGVSPNELTSVEDRDPIAGTPWHKHVAARLESLRTG